MQLSYVKKPHPTKPAENNGGKGSHTGGSPAPDPLRRLPPPSLEIGSKVPDHGRRRRPKQILLELVEGEKMGFYPMCLYSKYSIF